MADPHGLDVPTCNECGSPFDTEDCCIWDEPLLDPPDPPEAWLRAPYPPDDLRVAH